MYLSEKYPVVSKIHPLFLKERMKEKENQQQSPALHSESYQFLVEAGRSPVICGGVEGRVFAWHHRIGDNHSVSLVHAKATTSFNLRCQMGAGRVCEQASYLLVVFKVISRSVVDHAAATHCAGFSG